jgi:hypothetical protein
MDKQAGTELVERIHSNYEKLRKSERLVADFILSHLGKGLTTQSQSLRTNWKSVKRQSAGSRVP